MPILTMRIAAPDSQAQSRDIATAVGELTHTILGKEPELTAISLVHVDPAHWFVDGRSVAESGKSSFSLEIKITDETNTKAQKAQYIQAVFAAMKRLLGELDERSYVHVHDVRAAAYGYGGKTQEYRYHLGTQPSR